MMEPVSVLHVAAPARFGGLESVVSSLASSQAGRGLDVRVLAIVEPGESDHPFVMGLRDLGVATETVSVPPRRYLKERSAVVECCVRTQPAIVHLHGARVDVLDAPVIRRAGFPVVTTVHGFTGGDLRNRVYEALQRRSMERADAVVAVSRPLSRELIRQGLGADRVHVVLNAAPTNDRPLSRREARAQLGLPEHEKIIGWVGRLTREKGCDVFIEAIARLDRAGLAASIIGDGPERPELERAARQAEHQTPVTWHGAVASAARLLAAFDLLVISSRTEGTPMILFEAIRARVPVVSTAVGGIPDVVSDSEALLVSPDDPSDLAAAIQLALDDSRGSQRRVAQATSRTSIEFSTNRWVDDYSAVYKTVLDRRRVGTRDRPSQPAA